MNILVTNFKDSGNDVMIFSDTLTVDTVTEKLNSQSKEYEDITEVPTNDLQFYNYEPCYI